jgi:putative sterol carrier protein
MFMARFMSEEFFAEVQKALSEDQSWKESTKGIKSTVLLVVEDKKESYLISVDNGTTTISKVEDEPNAEFTFKGSYDSWSKIARGETDIQSAVLKGILKFKGSITKILFYKDRFLKIAEVIKNVPKEF